MLGDYFTNDLLSGSPKTTMVGNLINDSVLAPGQTGQAGAFVMLVLVVALLPMLYYVRVDVPRRRRGAPIVRAARLVAGGDNPWRPPRFLVAITVGLPAVVTAAGPHRGAVLVQRRPVAHVLAGLLVPLVLGRPTRSVWHDDALHTALMQTLKLGVITTLITVPLGVAVRDRHRPVARPAAARRELPDAAVVRAPRDAARRRAAVRDHHRRGARSSSAPPRR